MFCLLKLTHASRYNKFGAALHFQYGIPDKLKIVQFHSLVYENDKIVCCQSLIMHKLLLITIHTDNFDSCCKGESYLCNAGKK